MLTGAGYTVCVMSGPGEDHRGTCESHTRRGKPCKRRHTPNFEPKCWQHSDAWRAQYAERRAQPDYCPRARKARVVGAPPPITRIGE